MTENTTVKKRERKPNYAPEEKTYLAEIIAQYHHIIEDKRTGELFYRRKRDVWREVTKKYNSHCITGHRATEQLRSLYDSMKQQARRNYGECLTNTTIQLRLFQKPDPGGGEANEEAIKALQTMRENKLQMARDTHYEPRPELSDGVEPLSNPYDSAAAYFRDSIPVRHVDACIDPLQFLDVSLPDVDAETRNPPLNNTQEAENSSWDASQFSFSKTPEVRIKTEAPPPQQTKKPLTTEALKRLYFRRKCRNADLERKKILQDIVHAQQKHSLEMLVLRRNLDAQ